MRWALSDRRSSDSNLVGWELDYCSVFSTLLSSVYVLILKPLLLAMRPSAAVVGKKYSRPSLCTEILKGLFWLQTVCPAVPVTAVAGTADMHRSSVPQYLRRLSWSVRGRGQVWTLTCRWSPSE